MLRIYNYIIEGRVITVAAASKAEARQLAYEIHRDVRKEQEEKEPVRSN